jgi:hypothetical protein
MFSSFVLARESCFSAFLVVLPIPSSLFEYPSLTLSHTQTNESKEHLSHDLAKTHSPCPASHTHSGNLGASPLNALHMSLV